MAGVKINTKTVLLLQIKQTFIKIGVRQTHTNMKKSLLFLALFGVVTYSYTNSGGSPSGRSGSPASNGQTCMTCHGGGSANGSEVVSIEFASDTISPGAIAEVTLSANASGASTKIGFMASVENASGQLVTPSNLGSGTKLVSNYVSHTSSGTSAPNGTKSWTFDVATDANTPDSLTVYAAVNFTNSNGATSGDYVITTSKTFYMYEPFGLEEQERVALKVGPNPATNELQIFATDLSEARLYSTTGRFLSLEGLGSAQNDEITLDVSKLARGNYILHAVFKDGTTHYKHVILQ